MSKQFKVLEQTEVVTSTNCCFRKKIHSVVLVIADQKKVMVFLSREDIRSKIAHTLSLTV